MRFFSTIIALCFTLSLSAQIVVEPATPAPTMEQTEQAQAPRKDIRQHLAETKLLDTLPTISGRVVVEEVGDAAAIVEANLHATPKSINGYRIVIFMSNKQSARQEAVAMQQQFMELYPTEKVYLSYDNPYFKVMVGNCLTKEEAILALGNLQGTFPKAFITSARIAIRDLAK
jgi:hypothetical protein